MNKKTIIISIIVLLVAVFIFQALSKNGKDEFETVNAEFGQVLETVSETGQVQKGEKINISFKNSGEIESIWAKVGQSVSRGTWLAKLDTSDLEINLKESEAALAVVQAKLDKLLAGATQEEIQKYQTAVNNKGIALEQEEQDLDEANEDGLNEMESAYLYSYNAQITVSNILRDYFRKGEQEKFNVESEKLNIDAAVSEIKTYLDLVKSDFSQENIDSALSAIKKELSNISTSLGIVRDNCETDSYRDVVSAADKTLLDTHRTNINTAVSGVTNAQQTIEAAKLDIQTAEGNLQAAEDDLAFIMATPREEDVVLYEKQVDQVQAQVDSLKKKIDDSYLKSPARGEITKIEKRVGELVQASSQDIIMTLLPADPYEIKVDIYEEDVVKVKVGNLVEITLVAIPGKTFSGQVVSVDPAEKLVDGVVYYEVAVGFDETPEGIKPGMSADIIITTQIKENVLVVPEDALLTDGDNDFVEVLISGEPEKREVEIGLEGSNDMVEILSGLKEGDTVILR